ncbi:hypothetical protein [Amphritea pacifica]|uniref:hypothetical protein n=1 Tax=Amphritea pacifica TaxID=2811233 RepID=UPI00196538B3|nr:hypothetical protein [Amphritea pacifica]MBN1006363.1 hypothetical protein [Amphritea pacifica]
MALFSADILTARRSYNILTASSLILLIIDILQETVSAFLASVFLKDNPLLSNSNEHRSSTTLLIKNQAVLIIDKFLPSLTAFTGIFDTLSH